MLRYNISVFGGSPPLSLSILPILLPILLPPPPLPTPSHLPPFILQILWAGPSFRFFCAPFCGPRFLYNVYVASDTRFFGALFHSFTLFTRIHRPSLSLYCSRHGIP